VTVEIQEGVQVGGAEQLRGSLLRVRLWCCAEGEELRSPQWSFLQ
jgi:hypothetical protein